MSGYTVHGQMLKNSSLCLKKVIYLQLIKMTLQDEIVSLSHWTWLGAISTVILVYKPILSGWHDHHTMKNLGHVHTYLDKFCLIGIGFFVVVTVLRWCSDLWLWCGLTAGAPFSTQELYCSNVLLQLML